MTSQLAVGSTLIVLSFAIHAGFMALAIRAFRRHETWLARPPQLPKLAGALCVLSVWLLASMSVTAWIWAAYLLWSGALADLETAVYFSLVSFTTLGFGDIVLDRPHRLLSGMLAANGLVLFGLTTAVLIDLIRSLHTKQPGTRPGD